MLCGLGRQAGVHAVYWAYGVCFYDAHHRSTVRIFSRLPDVSGGNTGGNITVEAAGPGATSLVQHLMASIQRINIGLAPAITWELGQSGRDPQPEEQASITKEQAFKAIILRNRLGFRENRILSTFPTRGAGKVPRWWMNSSGAFRLI
ncbi:hypothetical protein AWB67_02286 [Caballeronia terrestris]|uniref:Uncharacterized protein n=2 Tax=Caballeronia terrestris TaxID=1226301 RepID=A0A158HZX2_9BURK|nr:hypothetical protein AWB67_02286 [Caballeronia terrestris]